jgi:hypothetical protein
MRRIVKYILLIPLVVSLFGCDLRRNHYLGNLKLTYRVYANEEEIDSHVLGFYYGYSLMRFVNQYYEAFDKDGYGMVGFEIDSDINALQHQKCTIEGYQDQTWEYYFIVKATTVYQEVESLYMDATENGYKISSEDISDAEKAYNSIVTYCENNDIEVVDYLYSTFGKGMTKEHIISNYAKVAMSQRYAETLWVEPTEEQIEKYYQQYKDDVDNITIRYFAFSKERKEEAEAFKNAVTSEADFKKLARNYTEESMRATYDENDQSLRSHLRKEDLPEYLQTVLFDEVAPGTVTVVEGTTSYDVVMLVSREKPTYQQAQVATIYFDARMHDTDILTEEKMQVSKRFAEEILETFNAEDDPSLELFNQYNKLYSDDKNNNGNYDFVSRGDSTKEIEHWLFNEKRQVGDMTVLPSTNGYSILYFRGYGESEYLQRTKELAREKIYKDTLTSINHLVIRIEPK